LNFSSAFQPQADSAKINFRKDAYMRELSIVNPGAEVALSAKVAFLKQPDAYEEAITEVKAVETHRSWVFLTGDYAYKLKKPVRSAFMDSSTVAARKYYCEEEIRLNRRLAGDVYLGTIPLTIDRAGKLELNGTGPIVDWLVKMRRLPSDRMLDVVIQSERIQDKQIRAVAAKLAKFYQSAAPVEIAPIDYWSGFEREVRANLGELTRPVFGLRKDLVEAPCTAQLNLLKEAPGMFDQRVREGRIIEGHGDLRPEHIFLLEPEPVIIDCLEFNRELRTLDAAADLAFLAQECERFGAPQVGQIVLDVYSEAAHDHPSERLLSFYKSYWACVRAKLCVWHLTDPICLDPGKWSRLATEYLVRAGNYAAGFQRACIAP
jgi:aminoglycoside phosphotransferase family enzyme